MDTALATMVVDRVHLPKTHFALAPWKRACSLAVPRKIPDGLIICMQYGCEVSPRLPLTIPLTICCSTVLFAGGKVIERNHQLESCCALVRVVLMLSLVISFDRVAILHAENGRTWCDSEAEPHLK